MNWAPSGLGAEPKKLAVLGILIALIVVVYFYNQEPEVAVATSPRPAPPQQQVIATPEIARAPRAQKQRARAGNDDFHPTLKLPEDFDLSKVDPTLRTELLAKVREIGDAGGSRSLFEFYVPPPPPPPKVEPIKPDFAALAKQQAESAARAKQADTGPPKPPPPPPIPFKYYGYERPNGGRLTGTFIDGDEIFVKAQGETIKNRYRIVRIGTTSAEVEDTVAKNTQTLRILERCEDSNTCK